MRILKRNLAFLMVLAMALSTMVSAANVEDYKDVNDIKFVEAVDVLTALGVLQGEDGTFYPERTLTREEGAKIITYLMLGADAADNLTTSVAPFADVPAGRWSAGYIAYCASQGIVGGYGNGNFGPTDTLTATQFAKMLLCALGYGVNGEFSGSNWEIETNKQALTSGVYAGNLGVNFSNGVKREEAALYAFNTLTDIMTVNYSDVFGSYYSGEIFNTVKEEDEYKYTLGYTLYNLVKENAGGDMTDDFGRLCHTWKVNAKVLTDKYADEADVVYTASTTSAKVYAALGLTEAQTVESAWVDGVEETFDAGFTFKKGDTDSTLADIKVDGNAIIGNGVKVELFVDDETDEVTMVVVHTYLAQVTEYDADDEEVTVEMLGFGDVYNNVFETAVEYEEDDYVLVTVAYDDSNDEYVLKSVKAVETVQGNVTATSGSYIKLDGTQYNKAFSAYKLTTKDVEGDTIVKDSVYDIIVDDYGYAVAAVLVEESEDDTVGYIYVSDSQGEEGDLLTGKAAVVEVRYLDGSGTVVLPLETAKKTSNGESKLCFKFVGEIEGLEAHYTSGNTNWYLVTDLNGENALTGFYRYTMTSDDKIVLKELDDVAYGVELEGSVTFDGTNSVGEMRLNANSVLKTIDTDDNLKTYKGYKNINNITLDENDLVLIVVDKEGSALIKEIYALSDASVTSESIFAYYRGRGSDKETWGTDAMIQLYINGEADWYELGDFKYPEAKGLFVVKYNSDNELTAFEAAAVADIDENVYTSQAVTELIDGGFVAAQLKEDKTFGETRTFLFADEYEVYNVDSTFATGKVAVKNLAIVVENEDEEVIAVYIVDKDGGVETIPEENTGAEEQE